MHGAACFRGGGQDCWRPWVGGESISGSQVLNVPQLGMELLRWVCCVEGNKDPAGLVQCCIKILANLDKCSVPCRIESLPQTTSMSSERLLLPTQPYNRLSCLLQPHTSSQSPQAVLLTQGGGSNHAGAGPDQGGGGCGKPAGSLAAGTGSPGRDRLVSLRCCFAAGCNCHARRALSGMWCMHGLTEP